ncbi:GH92 family glycosyl hydrolase [Enterococcus caccae]|uniref:Alpha-1,2-mannosidase n=1 Tax=Enterococcus caccae ATCC BAA-1240 TaxID=1158612 RepID=R3X8H4_9ENTE|nr:GH92 family glycosyl hydrolase [Enterococcus caccae]EOL50395.1 alpha-1,2-mannosidase [Enterococcus caccae ATCC BAA-1240]EOT59168.1 alpha-1,2-mannosidase [Enterococcus caccae ATCC BAA-1240]OJG25700.1 alpha-1,2-mannosidase [Enterococcus caccae]
MNSTLIDTRHGTDNQHSFSNGNCLPYTGVPFGMNYFAPQTNGDNGSWWFNPRDRIFQGFRLTHQPSPWMGDFSYLVMLPFNGNLNETNVFHAQSSYRPDESVFNPSYLEITAQRYQLTTRMIPSMYGGVLTTRYTHKDAKLLLSLPGKYQLTIEDAHTVSGSIINYAGCEDKEFSFYFTMYFKQPLTTETSSEQAGTEDCLAFSFGDIKEQIIQFGTSFVSLEQAKLNLSRELDWQPEDYLTHSQEQWAYYLNKIEIQDKNQQRRSTFYHNFYRAFLFPQTFYEKNSDNQIIHYDTLAKEVKPGFLYTNNGFWDTYKTVYPLYSLIAQEKYAEMLEGFLNSYRESGYLPKWLSPDERGLMPGTLIDAVIADAAVKNIRPDLIPEFLDAMIKGATIQSENPNYGRQGTNDYLTYGYVPTTYHESVNHTLDYCYSDFCISQVAKVLEKKTTAEHYEKQAKNYLTIFDPDSGFMRAKQTDGAFKDAFDSHRWGGDYAEGSAWQSSFAVYHDFKGLITAYGGPDKFLEKLIDLCNQPPSFNVDGYGFEIHEMSEMAATEFGQLAISNQPSFHLPYLFSYLGKPEFAQPLLKQLMIQEFNDSPTGFPGDEDNGSMASWYIFNSLGFYPVCPGSGEYVIGIPLFDKTVLHLSNGETLTISTSPNQDQQQFIDHIRYNDALHESLVFEHDSLMNGGTIDFTLGTVPRPRKRKEEQLPFSI